MKYVIDRKRWQRGKGASYSALYLPENRKMCCLGQVAKQCSIKPREMRDDGSPSQLEEALQSKLPKWLLGRKVDGWFGKYRPDSRDCGRAMSINDNPEITDAVREKRLKAIFAKHGDELEFIN